MRPEHSEYLPYFSRYIDLVPGNELIETLNNAKLAFNQLLMACTEEKSDLAYAEGKWTVKQLIAHIIDVERVFNYRILRIARENAPTISGFDHDEWAKKNKAEHRSLAEMLEEFNAVRTATIQLFKSFSEDDFTRMGTANNGPLSIRAAGFIVVGHQMHHSAILKEKYL